ncbi:MAG: preprotein translocase subunit SecG [Bacteroidia bacterium]|nr:preprotein translocase subunit SecG [Bacteroidia bacterium]MBP9688762.1 preprotein translocase subunit SecG [Bacteroidia bacterium]
MYTVFSIIIILVCILLTLVVLIQNPKGGGIAANFASPNQIMGAKRSSDFIEKATWILAIVLIVLSLGSNFVRPTIDTEGDLPESRIKDQIENTAAPAPLMAPAPTQETPATTPGDGSEPATAPATEPAPAQ